MTDEERANLAMVDCTNRCADWRKDPQARIFVNSGPHSVNRLSEVTLFTPQHLLDTMRDAALAMWQNDPDLCEELIEVAQSGTLSEGTEQLAALLASQSKRYLSMRAA